MQSNNAHSWYICSLTFSALMLLAGWQEGHLSCKKTEWWGTGVVICLERDADLHMAQLMLLPLTVPCFSKIQIGFTFLVPADLGSPVQRAVKQVCVCIGLSEHYYEELAHAHYVIKNTQINIWSQQFNCIQWPQNIRIYFAGDIIRSTSHGKLLTRFTRTVCCRLRVGFLANHRWQRRSTVLATATSGQRNVTKRLHHCQAWIVQLYLPGGTNVTWFLGLHMSALVHWLTSRVVSVLDSGAERPGFKSQPWCCWVTVLGKLFTPIVPLFSK